MPDHNLTTFAGARTFAGEITRYLTEQFNDTGGIGCFLVLFMTRDPNTGFILPHSPVAVHTTTVPIEIDPDTEQPRRVDPFSSPEAKSALVKVIRHTAARSGSVGLLLAHEAWLVTATPAAPIDLSIAPSAHQNRQEVVLLTLHHQGGRALWQAPIFRNHPDDGRSSLGAFTEIPLNGVTAAGPFCNLLPIPTDYN
jgi:hypothetical protein